MILRQRGGRPHDWRDTFHEKRIILLTVVVLAFVCIPLLSACAKTDLTGFDIYAPDGYTLSPSFTRKNQFYTLTTASDWLTITYYSAGILMEGTLIVQDYGPSTPEFTDYA